LEKEIINTGDAKIVKKAQKSTFGLENLSMMVQN
jgi:hypothetical protein